MQRTRIPDGQTDGGTDRRMDGQTYHKRLRAKRSLNQKKIKNGDYKIPFNEMTKKNIIISCE